MTSPSGINLMQMSSRSAEGAFQPADGVPWAGQLHGHQLPTTATSRGVSMKMATTQTFDYANACSSQPSRPAAKTFPLKKERQRSSSVTPLGLRPIAGSQIPACQRLGKEGGRAVAAANKWPSFWLPLLAARTLQWDRGQPLLRTLDLQSASRPVAIQTGTRQPVPSLCLRLTARRRSASDLWHI